MLSINKFDNFFSFLNLFTFTIELEKDFLSLFPLPKFLSLEQIFCKDFPKYKVP